MVSFWGIQQCVDSWCHCSGSRFLEFHHGVVGWFRFSGTQQCVDSRFRCLGDFEIMDFGTLILGACNLLWCEFVLISSQWQGDTRLVGMMTFSCEGFRET